MHSFKARFNLYSYIFGIWLDRLRDWVCFNFVAPNLNYISSIYYLICALMAVMLNKVMAVLRAILKMPKRWCGSDITKPISNYGKMLKYQGKTVKPIISWSLSKTKPMIFHNFQTRLCIINIKILPLLFYSSKRQITGYRSLLADKYSVQSHKPVSCWWRKKDVHQPWGDV